MYATMPFDIRNNSPSLGDYIQGTDFKSAINWVNRDDNQSTSSTEQSESTAFDNDCRIRPASIKMRKNFFPQKLMKILSSPDYAHYVAWRDDGKAFYFLDRDRFIQKISSTNPKNKAYKNKSFTRKLNRWGFRMHWKKGPDHGMYSHKLFQRDKPWLCAMMVAEKSNGPTEVNSDLQDEATEEFNRKRKSPYESMVGFENESLDYSMKKRRTSHGLAIDSQNEGPLHVEAMFTNLLEIDRKLALTEYLIEEKIRSVRSNPSLYRRMHEIQRLFGFQTNDINEN